MRALLQSATRLVFFGGIFALLVIIPQAVCAAVGAPVII